MAEENLQFNSGKTQLTKNQTQKAGLQQLEWDEDVLPSGRKLMLWLALCLCGVSGIILCFITRPLFYPSLKIGDKAYQDLRANWTTTVEDEPATKRAQAKARNSVVPVFKQSEEEYQYFTQQIEAELAKIKSLQVSTNQASTNNRSSDSQSQSNTKASGIKASAYYELYIAAAVPPQRFDNFARQFLLAAEKANRVIPRFSVRDNIFWEPTVEEFLPDDWSADLKKQSSLMICHFLNSNLMIDEDATRLKSEQLVAAVKPVTNTIEPGTVILKKGELVSADNIALLEAAGTSGHIRWPLIFTLVLSIIASSSLIGTYFYTYKRQYLFSLPSLTLIFAISITTCVIAITVGKTFPQLIPLPGLALILTVFFGRQVAFIITFPLLILLSIDKIIDINNLFALAAASGAAIYAYSKQRHDLVFTGFLIAIGQALGFFASLALAQPVFGLAASGEAIMFEFMGGIISAILSIGSLPFLENLFGLLTPFRLAELTNADQSLLRELESKAPGTYQHSLAVANLAEAGARAIGADANLVRAGALYHDLGKAASPKYFIENQLGDKNPHDSMSPEESREKVLGHVRDGIELAIKHGLPKAIRDFIPMHQGTSLMAYFYHKACVRDGIDNVDPNFYRYPGPKPHSKETAIVMLADVSEAVTRSMGQPDEEEVDAALTKILENRYQDGQLDQSTLTYKELQQVKEAFIRVWRTLHHERVKYPSTTTGRMPMPPHSVAPPNPQ